MSCNLNGLQLVSCMSLSTVDPAPLMHGRDTDYKFFVEEQNVQSLFFSWFIWDKFNSQLADTPNETDVFHSSRPEIACQGRSYLTLLCYSELPSSSLTLKGKNSDTKQNPHYSCDQTSSICMNMNSFLLNLVSREQGLKSSMSSSETLWRCSIDNVWEAEYV